MLIPADMSNSSLALSTAGAKPPSPDGSLGSPPLGGSGASDKRRGTLRRKDFQYKYGQKHHSYDKEKAPYPLSYDRDVLALEPLDNRLTQYLRGSISFVNFEEPPTRVLDLGCGTGTWAIDAAKTWPNCEVVGFDLVDVQIPTRFLDDSLAARIEWKHGNFLTTKLPFDDDEFDHIHIQSIATGVPESKWGNLFEEVCRVLGPGGSIEVIEDDIIFPALPRWFTSALRSRPLRANSISYPEGSAFHRPSISSQSFSAPPVPPSHDHSLIDSLFKSVFDNRFVNMTPSSVLPSYVTTYFRHVTVGPILSFPFPRMPPIQDLPPQIPTAYMIPEQLLNAEPVNGPSQPNDAIVNRPTSHSFSASLSASMSSSPPTNPPRPRTTSAPQAHGGDSSMPWADQNQASDEKAIVEECDNPREVIDLDNAPLKRFMLDSTLVETGKDSTPPGFLVPMDRLNSLSERSLAMHLYRSFQIVMASQEAMWEELKDRIRNRKPELMPFGWEDDEELEELQSRKKFEKLVERYRSDMNMRLSLWCSVNDLGWPLPPREPLSKAELIEEERLRESMIEARKQATAEEMEIPSRAVRVIVGYKL